MPDSAAGKRVPCPQCETMLTVAEKEWKESVYRESTEITAEAEAEGEKQMAEAGKTGTEESPEEKAEFAEASAIEKDVVEAPSLTRLGIVYACLMGLSALVALTGFLLGSFGIGKGWILAALGGIWFMLFFVSSRLVQ